MRAEPRSLPRRRVTQSLAWAVPSVAVAAAAPAVAGSPIIEAGCRPVSGSMNWGEAVLTDAGYGDLWEVRVPAYFEGIDEPVWFIVHNYGSYSSRRPSVKTTLELTSEGLIVSRPAGYEYSGITITPEVLRVQEPRWARHTVSVVVDQIDGVIGVRPEHPDGSTMEVTPVAGNVDVYPVTSVGVTEDLYSSADGHPAAIRIDYGPGGGTSYENHIKGDNLVIGLFGDEASTGDTTVLVRDVQMSLWADPTGQTQCGYTGGGSWPY